MAFVVRQRGPVIVERGVATALTLDVRDSADVQQTMSSITLGIWDAAQEIVAAGTAPTTVGPPATYDISAALTSDRDLSNQLLAIWTVTIGGTVQHFRQVIHLVRHKYHASITDTDLYALHSELRELIPRQENTWEKWRERARERIERDLIKMKTRPELIFDAYMLLDAHVALTLHYIFRDFASHLDLSPRYSDLAMQYGKQYKDEMLAFKARYDDNETGTIDTDDTESATPQIVLTAGPIDRR